ncbi:hypothetical protein [Galactobacter sp.]|uniref:hypothetical protein n=1 Tax=Galactobacter sp. TaxID=2676125 RepID=UPI0025BECA20|nr:hypothetical protein [Galactobacter sp.]
MSRTASARTGKVVSKSLLITVIVAAAFGALNALWWGAFQFSNWQGGDWVEFPVLVPEDQAPDLPLADADSARFSGVEVYGENGPEIWMHVAAVVLPFVVGGLICLAVILMASSLLRGKQFGFGTVISLFVVAVVTIGSGIAVPSLNAAYQHAFAQRLGLPLNGEQASTWVSAYAPDWQDCDWIMILLGLLISLGGWLVLRARKLRLDMEGTI